MKIVHAVRSDGFAGVERHVASLAAALTDRGHEVVVVGGDPEAMRKAVGTGPVELRPARTVAQVARELRRVAADAAVVHVHMTAAELAATLASATTLGFPPVVSTRHFGSGRGSGTLGGVVARVASHPLVAEIAISEFVASEVDAPTVVIPSGVPVRPAPAPATEREDVVLMAQRLEAEKRADLGLRAFAASGLAAQGWRLQVAGDGALRDELEALARELSIATSVDFLGTRTDVGSLMDRAALFLAPCPVEGLGMSVLEAIAGGLPTVAARAGGHVEILAGLDPSALYPPDDPDAAGVALAALAADPGRRDRFGDAAWQRQRERFSLEAQAAATEAVYAAVAAGRTPGQATATTPTAARTPSSSNDLVVVSLEAWDMVWRRNQHFVVEMLRADPTLRVLFVEPAADPLHQLSRRARPTWRRGLREAPPIEGVAPGQLTLVQPVKPLPRRLDRGADARLARQIRRAALRSGMDAPTLWINDPSAASLLSITPWPSLYDITDDWLAADRSPDEHQRLVDDEGVLLDRCEAVTVCSAGLVRTKGAHRPVVLVSNGVDLDQYSHSWPRPAALPPGAVVLYAGTVHPDRIDVDLLLDTAARVRGLATVVLVGPVVDLSPAELAALEDAGVRSLGARPWQEVPAFLQHADVLLVPHVVSPFTDSLDPIKLYEYRAAGRPIVSTPVAGFRDHESETLAVVEPERFADAVAEALESDDGARDDLGPADIPTWRSQAMLMAKVVDEVRAPR